ncbi:BPSL0761 family protein [Variovorax sp. dw_308]|uniref:BPSL0761 family protein n=1 Tax=Variovorax sp. dw_308 TaxID=2721546 RepID=UPI001C442CA5|nr:BPSL0761 family protein [Variovorax sp. dw_308]
MTLPFQRTRALLDAAKLLREMQDPENGSPTRMQRRAGSTLKHFPSAHEISSRGPSAARKIR